MNCQDARDANIGAALPGKITIGPKWYTPMVYIKAARELMGGIDIDPATDEDAQKRIKAKVYYTKETNGLLHPWYGRMLLCTPYKEFLLEQFILKALSQYHMGNVTEAVILTHTLTTWEMWFQVAMGLSDAICFHRGRIKWYPGHRLKYHALRVLGQEISYPEYSIHGSVFFYLGKNPKGFVKIFSKFGVCYEKESS